MISLTEYLMTATHLSLHVHTCLSTPQGAANLGIQRLDVRSDSSVVVRQVQWTVDCGGVEVWTVKHGMDVMEWNARLSVSSV